MRVRRGGGLDVKSSHLFKASKFSYLIFYFFGNNLAVLFERERELNSVNSQN